MYENVVSQFLNFFQTHFFSYSSSLPISYIIDPWSITVGTVLQFSIHHKEKETCNILKFSIKRIKKNFGNTQYLKCSTFFLYSVEHQLHTTQSRSLKRRGLTLHYAVSLAQQNRSALGPGRSRRPCPWRKGAPTLTERGLTTTAAAPTPSAASGRTIRRPTSHQGGIRSDSLSTYLHFSSS